MIDTPGKKLVLYTAKGLVWWISISVGTILHEGNDQFSSPLATYDKLIRLVGSLIPFIPPAIRIIAEIIAYYSQKDESVEMEAQESLLERKAVVSLCRRVEWAYIKITVLRFIILLVHYVLQKESRFSRRGEVMSDHIVLGASIVTILQIETVVLSKKMGEARETAERCCCIVTTLLVLAFAATVAIIALTSWDMFYTARYFHDQIESVVALTTGFVAFQVPAAIYVWYWV